MSALKKKTAIWASLKQKRKLGSPLPGLGWVCDGETNCGEYRALAVLGALIRCQPLRGCLCVFWAVHSLTLLVCSLFLLLQGPWWKWASCPAAKKTWFTRAAAIFFPRILCLGWWLCSPVVACLRSQGWPLHQPAVSSLHFPYALKRDGSLSSKMFSHNLGFIKIKLKIL